MSIVGKGLFYWIDIAVAALKFGFVIAQAIRRFGGGDEKEVTKYEVKAGDLAGVVLM